MKIQKEIGIKTGRKIETINQYNPFASYYTVSYILIIPDILIIIIFLMPVKYLRFNLKFTNMDLKIRESMLSGAESIKVIIESTSKDTCWENVKKLKLAFIDKKTKEFEKEEVKTPKADSPLINAWKLKVFGRE